MPIKKEVASSMNKVPYFMKALQAQHTQNLINATTIVPVQKKEYIFTVGFLMNTQILLFHYCVTLPYLVKRTRKI